MKNEHWIILLLLAGVGFLIFHARKQQVAAQPQPLPTTGNPLASQQAVDYIDLARRSLDLVGELFGGWGEDKPINN